MGGQEADGCDFTVVREVRQWRGAMILWYTQAQGWLQVPWREGSRGISHGMAAALDTPMCPSALWNTCARSWG